MYVCMYLCLYVCMHVCMHVCMYACVYACTHVCMCACMYVPAAVLGACRVYMLCTFVERPRRGLSAGNKLTHTRTRTPAMRRGHCKLKRIVHVIEVLLQNTLQTCCYRAPFAMANNPEAGVDRLSAGLGQVRFDVYTNDVNSTVNEERDEARADVVAVLSADIIALRQELSDMRSAVGQLARDEARPDAIAALAADVAAFRAWDDARAEART